MNQGWSGNECERALTLSTTTTVSKNSQKGVNSQVDYQNHNGLGPPKGLSFTGLRTQLKSSARQTLSNQQAQLKKSETVNLIENDAESLSRPLAWLL